MKQISIFFWFFSFLINVHAQDTISLKNGVIINASILEKSRTRIKYKLSNQPSDDTISCTKLSKVRTIHYRNGEVNLLSSQNPRSIFPFGINGGYNIIEMFVGSIDYFITPNISTEINFKYLHGNYIRNIFSFGGKYWFANKYGKNGFSPFVGLFFTTYSERNDYEDITWNNKPEWSIYYLPEVPIGISYISKFGFQTSLQLNNYLFSYSKKLDILPIIELRVGWCFKTGKIDIK
jgi:hypothetical protein